MAKKHEHHPEYKHLPATGLRARELGETYYFTGKRCTKDHLSPRYASSGNCVQCIANARGKVEINKKGISSKRSEENQKLALEAISKGFTEYLSVTPCPKGHYRKFVTTNNCIDCGLVNNKKRADQAKWSRVKKEYGLSQIEVEEMLAKQNFECEICKASIKTKYHIDHCHKTGKVRSLLCSKCNQAIGLLDEDQSKIQNAADYLKRFAT